jgi:hypothetical protein
MMKEKHGAINTLNLKLNLKFEVQLIKLMEFIYLYILSTAILLLTNIPMQYPLKLMQFILSFQVKAPYENPISIAYLLGSEASNPT